MAEDQREQITPEPEQNLLADALTTVVAESLAIELTAEQRLAVRENVLRHQQLAAALRAYSLHNADEPDMIFRPYRADN